MIEATYILTIDDLMDAGKAVYGYESSVKRHRLERLVIGLGLIAIVLTQKPSPLYWFILPGLLYVWSAIRFPVRYLKNHFQKSVTNEQIVAQIDEIGTTTSSPTGRSETKWAGFKFMIETPKTLSLLTNNNIMYVFPKRAFSEQSCEELRKLVVNNGIPTKPR
jgi:hypothetical protein